jgi:hypothetical protein
MSVPRDVWEGRPVTFAKITLEEGDAVFDTLLVNKFKGSRLLMALSMRYIDTNELVFSSPDEAHRLPLETFSTVARLAGKASYVNGLREDNPDAPPSVAGNGHDLEVPAGPSH